MEPIQIDAQNTRRGKIARLPFAIREELNPRLQNGEEGKNLVAWLNSNPEVRATTAGASAAKAINQQNLTNWKAGGYRDWEAKQEALEIARQFSADGPESAQAGAASLTDHLSVRWKNQKTSHATPGQEKKEKKACTADEAASNY